MLANASDEESSNVSAETRATGDEVNDTSFIHPQSSVFSWQDIVYDIEIKGESRRLLDHVSGWVKPGSLTALMGASGAGKTTLLDVLARRVKVGVISGETLANGKPLDWNFPRKIGYVQQQDLHLDTATVRESVRFSATLRQPKSVPLSEKYAYVEHVINALGMEPFADAVVGKLGEGLSLEQRKRLTIAVELAAKPELLLFLDEPTSGLDSQSSWEICSLLRKLAEGGQAILCTIHQPSAVLFEQFHRLLLLAPGGRTVYFGDIGQGSRTLLDYFEEHAARQCKPDENPAEYMLEVLGKGDCAQGWHEKWLKSSEHNAVQQELRNIAERITEGPDNQSTQDEFAMPFASQLYYVGSRVFQQYWRSPTYIWAKLLLSAGSGLFIGFSFYKSDHSLQGLQNIIFAVFCVCAILASLTQQKIMPYFVAQRDLFEIRERPSKAYSWKVFLIANIFVEIPYQIFTGIIIYAAFYYPLAGIQSSDRQALVLLYCIQFFVYASSFAHLVIAAMSDTESADAVVILLFSMMLSFNGVLIPPVALPGFWIFMYRVSPLTYWVSGIVATIVHDRPVECSESELSIFDPPPNQACQQYLGPYLQQSPGRLLNPDALSGCQFCGLTTADQFVSQYNINWDER
ncbi:hypothetical protein COH20_002803 [Aspergillus flavus]|nr:hypothetical protein COH21_012828 [Aspergillus flavus]RAQ66109.1 hypothetical protein COH20_002803 [Aspergillus flavus]